MLTEMIVWIGGGMILLCQRAFGTTSSKLLFYFILPFGLHLIWTYINVRVFPLEYSYLGRKERKCSPREECYSVLISWTYVAQAGVPGVKWSFYSSGFELKIYAIGRVFVPWDAIVSIDNYHKWGAFSIVHSCSEVRSPIVCPAEIGTVIQGVLTLKER